MRTLLFLATSLAAQEVSQSGLVLKAERPLVAQAERAKSGMVASVHEIASQVGVDVMKRGGNAVDAAVAVAFALAVVHPEAGNIGGGGYMLVRMADGRATAIDYKETAPAAASPTMYAKESESRVGYKASAVPGTVAGMELAHKKFGKLPWAQVLEPARRLAAKGFPASQRVEIILALQVPVMKQFPESAKIFLHGGDTPLKQGELVVQSDLAATIARIQKSGARDFYEGRTAELIAADMKANNGTITLDDLKAYKAIEREPLRGDYRGHSILAMGPSSSGGTAVLQMLNILENFPIQLGEEGSSKARHLHVEAARRAFRDRAEFAGDPAFFDIPTARLISKEHAATLARTASLTQASPSLRVDSDEANESGETTHFSVIDADGTYLGKYRKQHIPQVKGFFEKFYFKPGNGGYPVFETAVGPVGVYICYDRHFPEGWRALGLNGAQIVFNPSATHRGLSEYIWKVEQPAAAVANIYYVGAINRVGIEELGDNDFYGQSYFVDPEGKFVGDVGDAFKPELIVRDLDMGLIRTVRDRWAFYRDRRPDAYDELVAR